MQLRADDAMAEVAPAAGGRLAALTVNGYDVLLREDPQPQPSDYGWGCYPMAPWAGRLRDNRVRVGDRLRDMPVTEQGWALHGTLVQVGWRVVDATDSAVSLAAPLGPAWPEPGEVLATWALGAGQLEATLTVATHGGAFPATCGWHPWFHRRLRRGGVEVGPPAELDLAADGMLERGPDHLPTGRTLAPPAQRLTDGAYDDCFHTPRRRAVLRWPGALEIEMISDCPWTVVFTEQPYAVCVEPQTGPPDAVNETPRLVTADDPLRARMRWQWS